MNTEPTDAENHEWKGQDPGEESQRKNGDEEPPSLGMLGIRAAGIPIDVLDPEEVVPELRSAIMNRQSPGKDHQNRGNARDPRKCEE